MFVYGFLACGYVQAEGIEASLAFEILASLSFEFLLDFFVAAAADLDAALFGLLCPPDRGQLDFEGLQLMKPVQCFAHSAPR